MVGKEGLVHYGECIVFDGIDGIAVRGTWKIFSLLLPANSTKYDSDLLSSMRRS